MACPVWIIDVRVLVEMSGLDGRWANLAALREGLRHVRRQIMTTGPRDRPEVHVAVLS